MSHSPTADREAVRLLAIEIGEKAAAEQLGISYDRVRQWSHRYHWKRKTLSTQQPVTVVTARPGDVLLSELAEHEAQTRISLARSARRMAKDCEELPVKHADKAYTVAKTMAIVHRQDEGKANQFTLNVLNINSLNVEQAEE